VVVRKTIRGFLFFFFPPGGAGFPGGPPLREPPKPPWGLEKLGRTIGGQRPDLSYLFELEGILGGGGGGGGPPPHLLRPPETQRY